MPDQWNLKSLLKSDADPRIPELQLEIEQANRNFIKIWKGRSDHLTDPAVLLQALNEYEELARKFGTSGNLGYYFSLRGAQSQDDPTVKAQNKKVHDASTALGNDLQFFELELAKVPITVQKELLSSAVLLPYRHWLEKLFVQASHTLSDPEERILSLKAPVSHTNWMKLTQELLSSEVRELETSTGRQTLPFEQILKLTSDSNKGIRDRAASSFNEIIGRHIKVAEAELNSLLADKQINDQLRHFEHPESARLLSDDIEPEVVQAMLQAVTSRFDISQRYYRLKAKMLGLTKLAYHERALEFTKTEKKYSFDKSVALVRTVLKKLDPEFGEIFDRLLENNQVDVYPRANKRGGAFCAHGSLEQPVYVLLNHTDTLNDVLTLAHEFGHAINDELMRKEQNELNFGTSLATAEVASTFMEDFVIEHLLQDADPELQQSLSMLRLDRDVSTIFRQVACFNFERELHRTFRERGFLSYTEIGALFLKHMGAYMGDAVSLDPGSENWWAYWGHIRSFFYVYSYASGELISKSLQEMVRENPARISDVKRFLSAGLSRSPQQIFSDLGINIADPAFWLQGIQTLEKSLRKLEVAHEL